MVPWRSVALDEVQTIIIVWLLAAQFRVTSNTALYNARKTHVHVLLALGNGAALARTFRESYANNIMAPGTRNNSNIMRYKVSQECKVFFETPCR